MVYKLNDEPVKYINNNVLMHYGIKGMKWGHRKIQLPATTSGINRNQSTANDDIRKQKIKRAAKIGAAVVGTALAVYGAKKLHDVVRDKNLKRHIEVGRKIANNLSSNVIKANDTYAELARDRLRRFPQMGISDLESKMSRNEHLISDIYRNELDKAYNRAKTDSFGAALKNVVKDEITKRRR